AVRFGERSEASQVDEAERGGDVVGRRGHSAPRLNQKRAHHLVLPPRRLASPSRPRVRRSFALRPPGVPPPASRGEVRIGPPRDQPSHSERRRNNSPRPRVNEHEAGSRAHARAVFVTGPASVGTGGGARCPSRAATRPPLVTLVPA